MALILVIDDEPTIAMVVQEVLRDEGHDVETLNDGLTALCRLFCPPRPDMVLVDLLMPGANGRTVVEAMRRDTTLNETAIVLMTGIPSKAEALPAPGTYQAVIGKPFDLVDLVQIIHGILEHS